MFANEASRELFEWGFADLQSRFNPEMDMVQIRTGVGVWHDPRDSLWYAFCHLVRDDGDAALAERIIAKVLGMQELVEGDLHYGNFRWLYENEVVDDLNAVEFILKRLVHILLRGGDKLSAETRESIERAMRTAFEEVDRLDVHWTYTNIYLLDVHNSILGGQLLGDGELIARGRRRLEEWARHTREDGVPHEFNSPTYSAVQINAVAAIAQFAAETKTRDVAIEMEQFMWRHVAERFHVPTLQLAGPHSRAYRRDVTGSVGFLKVLLYKLVRELRLLETSSYYDGPGREGDVFIALTDYHCPEDALEQLRTPRTADVQHTISRLDQELATYITPEFALGTMSRPYGVGEPPEPWPQHNSCILYYRRNGEPRFGVLYCRYVMNEKRRGALVHESQRTAVDLWDEGTFRAAQNGGKAIVTYGLMPRGQSPVTGMRLDIRLLAPDGVSIHGPQGETLVPDDRPELFAGEPLAIADGDAYIGVIPLAAARLGHDTPIVLWRDEDETVISIYNYRGPPKQFWEYRSLLGPFFKGNVRNGFALSVVPRAAYASSEEFARALSAMPLLDSLGGSHRRIEFGTGNDMVSLDYDLKQFQ